MTLSFFWSQYNNLLLLVGIPILALTINWITIHCWRSFFAILVGCLVFVVSGWAIYSGYQTMNCNPPQSCEWEGLAFLIDMAAVFIVGIVYLVLAFFMRFAYRHFIWKGASPATGGKIWIWALALPGTALAGLLVFMLVTTILHSGLFVPWQRLDIPSEVPVPPGILPERAYLPPGAVEKARQLYFGTFSDVTLGSDQGRVLYARFYNIPQPQETGSVIWQVENGPPVVKPPLDQTRGYDAGCGLWLVVLPPPGAAADRVRSRECDQFQIGQAEYAILKDGSLWAWRSGVELFSFLRWPILLGPFAGFLLALILAMRWERREIRA